MRINKFNYTNMRNETHVEFHERAKALVEAAQPAALGIEAEYAAYKALYGKEVSLLDAVRASANTKKIHEQDRARDRLCRGLLHAVRSALYHFDDDKRRAAAQLRLVLQRYGYLAGKSLDEETAAIDDLLRELDHDPPSPPPAAPLRTAPTAVDTLGLRGWLDAIDQANRHFKDLMTSRYNEVSLRPSEQMKATRSRVDKAYRTMITRIEALAIVQGEDAYAAFAGELNAVVTRYKQILAQQTGLRKARQSRRTPLQDA